MSKVVLTGPLAVQLKETHWGESSYKLLLQGNEKAVALATYELECKGRRTWDAGGTYWTQYKYGKVRITLEQIDE